ncbi:MAG: hypothetical protein LBL16_04025 [Endomicrobium sp.]|jgi:hypothetical protein|nr:hypothetical protein [Endomicrobium sp.]
MKKITLSFMFVVCIGASLSFAQPLERGDKGWVFSIAGIKIELPEELSMESAADVMMGTIALLRETYNKISDPNSPESARVISIFRKGAACGIESGAGSDKHNRIEN